MRPFLSVRRGVLAALAVLFSGSNALAAPSMIFCLIARAESGWRASFDPA